MFHLGFRKIKLSEEYSVKKVNKKVKKNYRKFDYLWLYCNP